MGNLKYDPVVIFPQIKSPLIAGIYPLSLSLSVSYTHTHISKSNLQPTLVMEVALPRIMKGGECQGRLRSNQGCQGDSDHGPKPLISGPQLTAQFIRKSPGVCAPASPSSLGYD